MGSGLGLQAVNSELILRDESYLKRFQSKQEHLNFTVIPAIQISLLHKVFCGKGRLPWQCAIRTIRCIYISFTLLWRRNMFPGSSGSLQSSMCQQCHSDAKAETPCWHVINKMQKLIIHPKSTLVKLYLQNLSLFGGNILQKRHRPRGIRMPTRMISCLETAVFPEKLNYWSRLPWEAEEVSKNRVENVCRKQLNYMWSYLVTGEGTS